MAADDSGDDEGGNDNRGDHRMNDARMADGEVVNIRNDPRLRPQDEGAVFYLTHAIYWPLYLAAALPLQTLYHVIRYIWRHTLPVAIVLAPFDLIRGARYVQFVTPPERLLMFLRGSWIVTPSEACPWLYAHAEYKASAAADLASRTEKWDAVARQVFERDDHTCTCCGAEGGDDGTARLEADRIVPYERGGFIVTENMRTLCRPCHQARHAAFFDDIDPSATAR